MKKIAVCGVLLSIFAIGMPSVNAQSTNNDNIIWGGISDSVTSVNSKLRSRFTIQKSISVVFPDKYFNLMINNIIWDGGIDNIIWGG